MKYQNLFLFASFLLMLGMGAKVQLSERDIVSQLTHDGGVREYIVHVPPGYQTMKARPLVLVLHGGGGTMRGQYKLTNETFNHLADRDGFFVVYPQGLGKSWNEGGADRKGYAREHNIDDVGFFKALIAELEKKYPIDPRKVFSTGMSNGGLMSLRLACDIPGQIRAIGALTASIPEDLVDMCSEEKPEKSGLLLMNGTEDPIVPFNGGAIKVFGQTRGRVVSTEKTLQVWLARNGCKDNPKVREIADKDPEDGTRVTEYTYDQCASGVPVVFYKIHGGGHAWPGGWQYLREKRIGKTSRDIDAAEEVWKFFSSFN
jgi:polyhydroxybutyrate depolymerase